MAPPKQKCLGLFEYGDCLDLDWSPPRSPDGLRVVSYPSAQKIQTKIDDFQITEFGRLMRTRKQKQKQKQKKKGKEQSFSSTSESDSSPEMKKKKTSSKGIKGKRLVRKRRPLRPLRPRTNSANNSQDITTTTINTTDSNSSPKKYCRRKLRSASRSQSGGSSCNKSKTDTVATLFQKKRKIHSVDVDVDVSGGSIHLSPIKKCPDDFDEDADSPYRFVKKNDETSESEDEEFKIHIPSTKPNKEKVAKLNSWAEKVNAEFSDIESHELYVEES